MRALGIAILAIALACASGCKGRKSKLEAVDPALPDEPVTDDDIGQPASSGNTDGPAPAVPPDAAPARAEPYEPIVTIDAGPPAIVVPDIVE